MSNFEYTARDKSGLVKKGAVSALDRSAAATTLINQGLTPILLKEQKQSANIKGILGKIKLGSRVKLKDKVIFSRQFATMINAGVPIVQSLNILKEQTESKSLKEVVAKVADKVQGGSTLADALAAHPKVFNPVYVNMVRAGETGGILDEVLERLAAQQEKDAEIVGKVRSAMIYPAVITTVTIGAFVFLMTVIVPKLAVIFEDMGSQLPFQTRLMLSTSKVLTNYWYIFLIVNVALIIAFVRVIKTKRGKKVVDTIVLKLPIFGPIVQKVNLARFARTFGSLMSSGISILDALNATASALGNSVMRDEIINLATEVKKGKKLSEPIQKSKNFPPIVAQMVSVGEETGQLDTLLIKIATFYEGEVERVVAGITSIIEPILIMVLGGMIGFIVISVFQPISELSNSI